MKLDRVQKLEPQSNYTWAFESILSGSYTGIGVLLWNLCCYGPYKKRRSELGV